MPALAPLLDGNNGTLSMTLGLGDPTTYTYLMGESALILGRQIKEQSLYAKTGLLSLTAPVVYVPYYLPDSPGGGDGSGSGSSGGEASSPDGNPGSGNDGSDGDGGG